jgi:type II secretory pathway pseudopilin PulG
VRRTRRVLRLDALRDDSGMALAMALIFGLVIVVMAATALSIASSGTTKASRDQDFNGAMAAAYAGLEDYQSRLSNDNSYQQYGNPTAAFSASSTVRLPTGTQTNVAFGVGAAGTWAEVPGSAGTAKYRYEVDNSAYQATGTLHLRVSGRVGSEVRSLTADLRQQGFIDFVYFTDYEMQDPALSNVADSCVKYAWAGRTGGSRNPCGNIAFGSGDVINGPAHSNDTMRICDATFNGAVTTAYNPATGLRYVNRSSSDATCASPTFLVGTQPAYAAVIGMPSTNSLMKRETRSDLPADVPRPGCLYTGPTSIVFNAGGTMTVKSPYTKFTRTSRDDASGGSNTSACGLPGTGTNQLGSTGGATFAVVDNNLVFVQNVPTEPSDKNYTSTGALPATCSNALGYPIASETPPSLSGGCAYGSRNGDVFVKGDFTGKATIASENYVYVTGDVKYADANNDILGLVGQNAVWVWNPMRQNNTGTARNPRYTYTVLGGSSGRQIDAAIISVAHTFQVQNVGVGGNRGTLKVNGAIAQKFRGTVFSSQYDDNGDYQTGGYVKSYNYDPRLRYLAPPKFLSPVTTTYGVTMLQEVSGAYAADGSRR